MSAAVLLTSFAISLLGCAVWATLEAYADEIASLMEKLALYIARGERPGIAADIDEIKRGLADRQPEPLRLLFEAVGWIIIATRKTHLVPRCVDRVAAAWWRIRIVHLGVQLGIVMLWVALDPTPGKGMALWVVPIAAYGWILVAGHAFTPLIDPKSADRESGIITICKKTMPSGRYAPIVPFLLLGGSILAATLTTALPLVLPNIWLDGAPRLMSQVTVLNAISNGTGIWLVYLSFGRMPYPDSRYQAA